MVNLSDILKFCDETGYLSRDNRFKYLESLGVGVIKNGDFSICSDKGSDYMKSNQAIDILLNKKTSRAAIVESPIASVTSTHNDEITADEVDF